jgi:hypothetical protein
MATKLTKMKIKEVSLVSRPAIAKEFLLYKSEDGATEEPIMVEGEIIKTETAAEVVKAEAEDIEKGKKKDGKKPKPVEKGTAQPVCASCGEVHVEKEGDLCKECAAAASKKEVKKEEEPVTKEMELSKALEDMKVQKEALAKELEEIKKQAEIMKEAEITKEFIAKASADMKFVPTVSPAQFGPVLKAASKKLEKGEFDAIYGALKAANEYIGKNSMLTKELGVNGEDLSGEPAAQLDAIAKSMVQKDSSITYAKAYTLACEQHPEIYAQHVRNARRQ